MLYSVVAVSDHMGALLRQLSLPDTPEMKSSLCQAWVGMRVACVRKEIFPREGNAQTEIPSPVPRGGGMGG